MVCAIATMAASQGAFTMTEIKVDDSGELVVGCFYKLQTYPALFLKDFQGAITSSSPDDVFNIRFAKLQSDAKDLFECSRDPVHRTGSRTASARWDVIAGYEVAIACSGEYVVARDNIFDALAKAKLKGLRGVKCEVVSCQGKRPKHDYLLLGFDGVDISRNEVVVPVSENRCPFCKHGPVVCPSCGDRWFSHCPKCKKRCICYEGDETNLELNAPIMCRPTPKQGCVLDASKWDGCDFIGRGGAEVVTRRVIDKLLELHALSFQAIPLRTFVGTCTVGTRRVIEKLCM